MLYTECCNTECFNDEYFILSIVKLSAVIPGEFMFSAYILIFFNA